MLSKKTKARSAKRAELSEGNHHVILIESLHDLLGSLCLRRGEQPVAQIIGRDSFQYYGIDCTVY